MDSSLQLIVQELKLKVAALLKQKEVLEQNYKSLQNELVLLQTVVATQKNTNKELKEQNKIVKIAEALSQNSGANNELIQSINHYLREIDECIRLISDSKL